ncbi:SUMF1/EgtB/PvdO family nonheme iron enzyme [Candidatus Chloroploca asiatica]|uniref:NACHT domain-containing protein n=1 Tax=Candidatus Chloroploca asiatica TaxID=1506545 RepID=A0A2H3KJ62_9CHLR|nr:SUMF1/EgtB/PvdO family nonheme iron enzyme [Candidatus Chloroploca asiatica]PDV97930.1 hypothetical protein A9Q02_16755 [Candidatus Chloroploca asiatica]
MNDTLATTITQLLGLHAQGLLDDAELTAKLNQLRARVGASAVAEVLAACATEAPLSSPAEVPRVHVQTVTGSPQVAVAGDVHGHVFLDGQRTEAHATLLATYLQRVVARCATLSLQPFHDQRDLRETLAVGLAQVYTELATTADPVPRERLTPAELASFDAAAFWRDHVGPQHGPRQRRLSVIRPATDDEQRQAHALPPGQRGGRPDRPDPWVEHACETLDAAQFAQMVAAHPWVQLTGPQLVTEAVAGTPRLVLLGEPGSGKSTVCRYLALTLAQAALTPTVPLPDVLLGWPAATVPQIPVLVPLLPFARRLEAAPGQALDATALWNDVAATWQGEGRSPGLAAALHHELDAGRMILFLDGLDEVPTVATRRLVVQALEAFATAYPDAHMVVACRVRAYEGARDHGWHLAGWPTATLAPWTDGQMRQFVAGWYAAIGGLPATERARRQADLQLALTRRPDLQRLGSNPMLLTIMALVHFNESQLPEERAALYGRCVAILLARWELGRIGYVSAYGSLMTYLGMPEVDVQRLRPMLQQAAYRAHQAHAAGQPGRLARAEVRELVAEALAALQHPNPYEGAKQFLTYTDGRAGLLHAQGAGEDYVFPHQTFQEYLAGLELVRGPAFVEQMMAVRHDDRWQIPMMLGLGHAVHEGLFAIPYQFLSRLRCLRERSAGQRQQDLLLAAVIAADVGWKRLRRGGDEFGQLQEDLAADLASLITDPTVPAAVRVQAGALVAPLGDPRPGVCTLPPAMVELPGGSVMLGVTAAELAQLPNNRQHWFDDAENEADVPVPGFAIGRYPVTNAQYAEFIAAGGYDPAAPWWDAAGRAWLARDDDAPEGFRGWRRQRKDQPEAWDDEAFGYGRGNSPVVGVNWYEAMAFGRWLTASLNDGFVYRLPSEAEWEYAARRPTRRIYPWGAAEPEGERANFNRIYDGTTAVGCFPAGATPDGVLDLAGNVWEWTRSVYRPYPYDPALDDGQEEGADAAEKRFTLCGGSWYDESFNLRAANRNLNTPDGHLRNVGFRLARHPHV